MAGSDRQNKVNNMESKSELKYIFANVNDFLKFAEAKHAGISVLNAGLVIGILSSYIGMAEFIFKPSALIGVISFGVSVLISIFSQFPVTQNIFYNRRAIQKPNLYFFGHLCHFDNETFIDEFKKADANFVATKLDN